MTPEEWKKLPHEVKVWVGVAGNRKSLLSHYDADNGASTQKRSLGDLKWAIAWNGETTSAFQNFMSSVTVGKFSEYVAAIKEAAAPKKSVSAPPILKRSIRLIVTSADSGNMEQGPKYKFTQIASCTPEEIMEGNSENIEHYLSVLQRKPMHRFARILVAGKLVQPRTDSVMEALLTEIKSGKKEIDVYPEEIRTIDISRHLAKALKRIPVLHHISSEEAVDLDEIHARSFEEDRPAHRVEPLYHADILVREIASDLGGDPTSVEELIEVNRIIQTSGTNMELAPDTAAKTGLREKDVWISAGLRLARFGEIKELLKKFVVTYNIEINKVRPCRTAMEIAGAFETAVKMHQEFVYIHPFINGNGRVARVLFYNFLLAANIPLFAIDPKDSDYMGFSGLHLTGQATPAAMATYLMSLHLHRLMSA